MSITDENQKEIIRLGTVHSSVFKASLYVMPIILAYFVTMVLRHDTDIAVLKERIAIRELVKSSQHIASKSQETNE
jgi:hypothetical protein